MLTTNTMRYGTDNFVFRKQSLLTTSKPWDTTGKTNIEGFELAGIQPADSNRSVILAMLVAHTMAVMALGRSWWQYFRFLLYLLQYSEEYRCFRIGCLKPLY